MKLHEAANMWDVALSMIKSKGYEITTVFENDEVTFWRGVKGDKDISGGDPLALLGLISIAEEYGEDWTKVSTGNLYDEIIGDETLRE